MSGSRGRPSSQRVESVLATEVNVNQRHVRSLLCEASNSLEETALSSMIRQRIVYLSYP
jgi:hypothetical protein